MATTTTGRQTGASNYTSDEVRHLLDVMENILPIGGEECDQVVSGHAANFAGRDVNSIRHKYSTLHHKQIPTGDLNMPPEVRQAKRIKFLIGHKADLGDGEELYQLQQNAFASRSRERGETQEEEYIDIPPLGQPSQTEEEEDKEEVEATTAVTSACARPPSLQDMTLSGGSTCAYRKAANHEQFLEIMRLQMQQESAARDADRQLFRDGLNAMMTGMTAYFASQASSKKKNKKNRKRKHESSSSDSSDSD